MVGQTLIKVKFVDKSIERMGFKLNSLNYHHVGLMEEFQASVTLPEDPNSIKKTKKILGIVFISHFCFVNWSIL